MTIKLPEPVELSSPQDERAVYGYTEAQLKQCVRDVLEQAVQVAVDAVAFNGGTVQMEAHVREAIRKMQEQIK